MAQLIIKLKERELRRHAIDTRNTRIGRDATCEVAIDNIGISRLHARVAYADGEWSVHDAGSQNGLFVNGALVTATPLQEGDSIQVGKFELIFSELGGVPVTDLADTEESNRRRIKNPLATTALNADDIERFIRDLQGSREGQPTPRRSAHPQPPAPAPTPPDNGVGTLKVLVTVFGLATLALAGVVIYLLTR